MAVESGEDAEQQPEPRADTSGASVAPDKPKFSPLTAYELNGKKIEFRRVSRLSCMQKPALRKLQAEPQCIAGPCSSASHDAIEEQLA